MIKKKRKRIANYFDGLQPTGSILYRGNSGIGLDAMRNDMKISADQLSEFNKSPNLFNKTITGLISGTNDGLAGTISNSMGALGSAIGSGISGGLSSGAGNFISGAGKIAGTFSPVVGAGLNIIGGLVNRAFGSTINEEAVNNMKTANLSHGNTSFDSTSTGDLLNQNLTTLSSISESEVGKDGWFSNKAKNLTDKLNTERNVANAQYLANYNLAANNIDNQTLQEALANYKSFGGPINMRYSGIMSPFGNRFDDGGGIHIKKENRGKFTALKERTGKSASWFKEHGTPAQKKMAVFALNARKWKHADGGELFNTHGGMFSNGLTYVNNGGTHEENPNEGIQMGVDTQGIPNLVEEGEVVFNDYVFSNRIKVPKDIRNKYKLGNKELTFAEAAKKMSKESDERPNDPISQNGLNDSMFKLQQAQEYMRQSRENRKIKQYAHGGKLGLLFDGVGPYEQFLNNYGKNPYELNGGTVPNYTTSPDDNELLDVARIRLGEAPKGTGNSITARSARNENNIILPTRDSKLSMLRYAPVVGAAIGVGQNIFSKPDYSSSNALLDAAMESGNYTPIDYKPIGDYLTYRPFDRNFYINKLNAQSGATRRSIVNQSAGNRATAMAGLLAADYNAQSKLGDLARQAEEYNLAQRQSVGQFNRQTNMSNSEMKLKADMANQELAQKSKSVRLNGIAQAMAMRDAIDGRRDASMNANLTNLFDSLGNIGIDAYNRADRDMLINAGIFGTLSQKPQGWSDDRWNKYREAILGSKYSKGGRIKKRRGGLTY